MVIQQFRPDTPLKYSCSLHPVAIGGSHSNGALNDIRINLGQKEKKKNKQFADKKVASQVASWQAKTNTTLLELPPLLL